MSAALLPAAVKSRLQALAEAWGVPVAEREEGADGVPLAPAVRPNGDVEYACRADQLVCKVPCTKWSPWDERRWDTPFPERELAHESVYLKRQYPDRLASRKELPIARVRDELLQAVRSKSVTLVAAETGSGKSTQVPQYLVDDAAQAGEGLGCHVVCTQPRRLAALSLAERVAWERAVHVGGTSVGHMVRFDERPPRPWASMVFCTVGALLPRLRRLRASHIIIDEAHTRDVHTDFLLTLVWILLRNSAGLKVIIMSATFNISKLLEYFGGHDKCAVVHAYGRQHHVDAYFLEDIITTLAKHDRASTSEETGEDPHLPEGVWDPPDCNLNFVDLEGEHQLQASEQVRKIPEHLIPLPLMLSALRWVATWCKEGSVLIFLPGWQEIAACDAMIGKDSDLKAHYEVVCLHSSVPPEEQRQALQPPERGRMKVILSTDIAETSITIPHVVCVLDSGIARIKMQNAMVLVWASQANLLQRRGRAGRVKHGVCIHFLTKTRYDRLRVEPEAEMKRVALDEVVLKVCDLRLDYRNAPDEEYEQYGQSAGVAKFLNFTPDPPEPKGVWKAFMELQRLGALDHQGYLTHLGGLLVRMPLQPALGAALFLGGLLGRPDEASLVVAVLDGREPWVRRRENDVTREMAKLAKASDGSIVWSDAFVLARLLGELENVTERKRPQFCNKHGLIFPIMQQMLNVRGQLWRTLQDLGCQQIGSTSLERAWPSMQLILTVAFDWNLGRHECGRRVDSGARRTARLAKFSVFSCVDTEQPPPLLVYGDYVSRGGGHLLLKATTITPYHVLLAGGRNGPLWSNDIAILDNWLHVAVDFETGALIGALRAVTRLVVQASAVQQLATHPPRERLTKEQLNEWRECVKNVVGMPVPDLIRQRPAIAAPAHVAAAAWQNTWGLPASQSPVPSAVPLASSSAAPAPLGAGVAAATGELPLGWVSFSSMRQGKDFFACFAKGESRWKPPQAEGRDAPAGLWRWKFTMDGRAASSTDGLRQYFRVDSERRQTVMPDVGDAMILPDGWDAIWDKSKQSHFYYNASGTVTWDFPASPIV